MESDLFQINEDWTPVDLPKPNPLQIKPEDHEWDENEKGIEEEEDANLSLTDVYKNIYQSEEMTSQGVYNKEQKEKFFGPSTDQKDVKKSISESLKELERREQVTNKNGGNVEDYLENVTEEEKQMASYMTLKHPEQEVFLVQVASKEIPPCSPIPHIRIIGFCKKDKIAQTIQQIYKKDPFQKNVTIIPYFSHRFGLIPSCIENLKNGPYRFTKCKLLEENYLSQYQLLNKIAEQKSNPEDETPVPTPIYSSQGLPKKKKPLKPTHLSSAKNPSLHSNKSVFNKNSKKKQDSNQIFSFELAKQSGYQFAVIIMIKDIYCKKGETPEHMIQILQCFPTEKMADVYKKCVAGPFIKDYHLDTVEMYKWGCLEDFESHSNEIPVSYRNREYQLIMDKMRVEQNKSKSYQEYREELEKQEKEKKLFNKIKKQQSK